MEKQCPVCKADEITQWVHGLDPNVVESTIRIMASTYKKSKQPHIERMLRRFVVILKQEREMLGKGSNVNEEKPHG